MIAAFIARNPTFALRNVRSLGAVRRAMQQAIARDGCCKWCRSPRALRAHHKLPVHLFPELAAVLDNLVTLCRHCHLSVGHATNFRNYVVWESIRMPTIVAAGGPRPREPLPPLAPQPEERPLAA